TGAVHFHDGHAKGDTVVTGKVGKYPGTLIGRRVGGTILSDLNHAVCIGAPERQNGTISLIAGSIGRIAAKHVIAMARSLLPQAQLGARVAHLLHRYFLELVRELVAVRLERQALGQPQALTHALNSEELAARRNERILLGPGIFLIHHRLVAVLLSGEVPAIPRDLLK